VPTPHGAIKVYWEWKGDGGYYLSLTVPQNTQCQLFFPDQISVNDVQKANFLQGVSPERIPIPTEGPPLAPNDIPLTPGYKIPPGQYSIHVSR